MDVKYPPEGARMCEICLNATDNPLVQFREYEGRFLCLECVNVVASPIDHSALMREWEHVMDTLRGARGYDFLLAYSGGADSTAALKLLVDKYKLKVLAFTIDNGMKHDPVWQNALAVTRHLGVDWLYVNDVKRAVGVIIEGFRSSDIGSCSMCNKGWRFPNYKRLMKEYEASCILTGLEIPHGGSIIGQKSKWLIKMMAAHMMPKKEVFEYISDLPWKNPGIVQGFDTDCLGGGFGLELYRQKHARHAPIVISFLSERVRLGLMDREEEMEKLNHAVPEEHWAFLSERFGPIREEVLGSHDAPPVYQLSTRRGGEMK
jgi:predicted PP-loop superfamily ATPase